MDPTPKPGILDVSLYVGGRSTVAGVAKVVKLSANESPIGPSPKAMAALSAAAHDLQLYPDGSARLLREWPRRPSGWVQGRIHWKTV